VNVLQSRRNITALLVILGCVGVGGALIASSISGPPVSSARAGLPPSSPPESPTSVMGVMNVASDRSTLPPTTVITRIVARKTVKKASTRPSTTRATKAPPTRVTQGAAPKGAAPTQAIPKRLTVKAIGVNVPLFHLTLDKRGVLQPPANPMQAGWWKRNGSTVIVGHVDSKNAPAIFYRVRQLAPGDPITLETSDGVVTTYVTDRIQQVKKTNFPTDAVYRSGPGQLRLVTCGGRFDRKTGHYEDNIIAFATAT
jgi:sortase (surface protein transpeptidase)